MTDCTDGSDERNCSTKCQRGEFACNNKHCIQVQYTVHQMFNYFFGIGFIAFTTVPRNLGDVTVTQIVATLLMNFQKNVPSGRANRKDTDVLITNAFQESLFATGEMTVEIKWSQMKLKKYAFNSFICNYYARVCVFTQYFDIFCRFVLRMGSALRDSSDVVIGNAFQKPCVATMPAIATITPTRKIVCTTTPESAPLVIKTAQTSLTKKKTNAVLVPARINVSPKRIRSRVSVKRDTK